MDKHHLKITLVVDNEAEGDLLCEHGFAAWIELDDRKILFDTGQGAALIPNCERLGIDPGHADTLVLSHGHYDHSGNIPEFLNRNPDARLYFGSGFRQTRFSCHPDKAPRDISVGDGVRQAFNALPEERRIEVTAHRYLFPGVGISGPIPRLAPFEDSGGPFFFDAEKQQADLIDDELSLWFETRDGLLVLTGCCHAGLLNTLDHIRQVSGIRRIHGIIGGLHLLNASAERLDQTCRFLADCAPDFIAPCHCTGAQAVQRLLQEFGTKMVRPGRAGQVFSAEMADVSRRKTGS